MQFTLPLKMCLASNRNLLVSENRNNRVQELTVLGEAEPRHVRFIPLLYPWSIAAHMDKLAVGTTAGAIKLMSYTSGALICSIGSSGCGPGQIGGYCVGLRFTPDGQCIAAVECSNARLSMFRVSDGSFVKHIGVGVITGGDNDVELNLRRTVRCLSLTATTTVCACSALMVTRYCVAGAREVLLMDSSTALSPLHCLMQSCSCWRMVMHACRCLSKQYLECIPVVQSRLMRIHIHSTVHLMHSITCH
jgi:hypothetical protein